NYGKIDLLFFDGRPEVISMERIRELQPSILVNERMHGYGDFATPECHVPADAPAGPWEVVDTWDMAGRWGYAMPFVNRPAAWVAERLSLVRAMGGNYMINLAPKADGSLPDGILHDFDWLVQWRGPAEQAFRDVAPLPAGVVSNVPAVCRGRDVYLFPPNPFYSLLQLTGVPAPESARLLSTGADLPHGHIPTFRDGPRLNVLLPPDMRCGGDIVQVRFAAPVA
ncbi:MAG TPA: alpha-L-fucosidase, partial [Terrimicrobiaceae bacterium]|nr:alpha-L-fucosidase [Terrimicrobiaceae bacterium]